MFFVGFCFKFKFSKPLLPCRLIVRPPLGHHPRPSRSRPAYQPVLIIGEDIRVSDPGGVLTFSRPSSPAPALFKSWLDPFHFDTLSACSLRSLTAARQCNAEQRGYLEETPMMEYIQWCKSSKSALSLAILFCSHSIFQTFFVADLCRPFPGGQSDNSNQTINRCFVPVYLAGQ